MYLFFTSLKNGQKTLNFNVKGQLSKWAMQREVLKSTGIKFLPLVETVLVIYPGKVSLVYPRACLPIKTISAC